MTERVFDRVVKYDEKSKAFPIRELIADSPRRSMTWRHVQLDQGSEGACTGFSATMQAAARPKPWFGDPGTNPDVAPINAVARQCYKRAQQLDEYPGENYSGSSVLGATKAGQEAGWWTGYRWALGPGPERAAEDVIAAIGHLGPVCMGTNWYEGMFKANLLGNLTIKGHVAGGHAYLLTRYSRARDAVWTPNSWGGAGQGWISRCDLTQLLAESGEACIPMGMRMP